MRYLVVANQTLGGTALSAILDIRAKEGAQLHIVVPNTEAGAGGAGGASRRLETELERLTSAGISAPGALGAADPMTAVREAVKADTYDGIIVATLPAGLSRWLRMDLPHRVEREFHLPVEWIEARSDDADEPTSSQLGMPRSTVRFDRRSYPP